MCHRLAHTGFDDFFDVLLDLGTGQHDLTASARTADLEIHADPQHLEAGRPAGMLFAGLDGIAHCDIHVVSSLLPVDTGRVYPNAGTYRYSINQTRTKCKYLLPSAHTFYQPAGKTNRERGMKDDASFSYRGQLPQCRPSFGV